MPIHPYSWRTRGYLYRNGETYQSSPTVLGKSYIILDNDLPLSYTERMINITDICKRFGKSPSKFKDNSFNPKLFRVEREGKTYKTMMDNSLIPDFIIWLSKSSKELRAVLTASGAEAALIFAKGYRK